MNDLMQGNRGGDSVDDTRRVLQESAIAGEWIAQEQWLAARLHWHREKLAALGARAALCLAR